MRSGAEPSTVRYGRERGGQGGSGINGGVAAAMQGNSPSRRRRPPRHTPAVFGGCARKFMYCITVHMSGSVWFAFSSIGLLAAYCNKFAGYLGCGKLHSFPLGKFSLFLPHAGRTWPIAVQFTAGPGSEAGRAANQTGASTPSSSSRNFRPSSSSV